MEVQTPALANYTFSAWECPAWEFSHALSFTAVLAIHAL